MRSAPPAAPFVAGCRENGPDDGERLLDQIGAQGRARGSSNHHELRTRHQGSAGIASICCSPPDSVPAACRPSFAQPAGKLRIDLRRIIRDFHVFCRGADRPPSGGSRLRSWCGEDAAALPDNARSPSDRDAPGDPPPVMSCPSKTQTPRARAAPAPKWRRRVGGFTRPVGADESDELALLPTSSETPLRAIDLARRRRRDRGPQALAAARPAWRAALPCPR